MSVPTVNEIRDFRFAEYRDVETLEFIVDGVHMYMKYSDYDIPDVNTLFLNTYEKDNKTYFLITDVPDDTSKLISWRLVSRLISVALSK